MILLLFKVLSGVIGSACLYIAIFLYEGEEKKIQNRIEDQWIKFFETSNSQIEVISARAKSSSRLVKIARLARVFNPPRLVYRSPDRRAKAISNSFFIL